MPTAIDLTGLKFGNLTVLRLGAHAGHHRRWVCRCDCGKKSLVFSTNLMRGLSKSCGCQGYILGSDRAIANQRKHGHAGTALYWIWGNMKRRCENTRDDSYKNYGGRGIYLCERWQDVRNFIADMSPRPPGYTVERIDNDGPYAPENCRWASRKEQAANRRPRPGYADKRTA